jgi:hypothetical protein
MACKKQVNAEASFEESGEETEGLIIKRITTILNNPSPCIKLNQYGDQQIHINF